MEQIYRFEDWTSASRMKNKINPCLKIDVGVLRDPCIDPIRKIIGYQLTVIDAKVDRPVYKFYIDVGLPGVWSLTTDEAIEMLNQIGFPCEFGREHYKISSEAGRILESLKGLGYTHVSRMMRPIPTVEAFNALTCETTSLNEITEYNYHDFWFLTTVPTPISGLLDD